jgi:hypothetical protein
MLVFPFESPPILVMNASAVQSPKGKEDMRRNEWEPSQSFSVLLLAPLASFYICTTKKFVTIPGLTICNIFSMDKNAMIFTS